MPDIDILIELADFYCVDIREIISGERINENMDIKTKNTLKQVAEYAEEKSKKKSLLTLKVVVACTIIAAICVMLFGSETKGFLYGIVPETVCNVISWSVIIPTCIIVLVYLIMDSKVL